MRWQQSTTKTLNPQWQEWFAPSGNIGHQGPVEPANITGYCICLPNLMIGHQCWRHTSLSHVTWRNQGSIDKSYIPIGYYSYFLEVIDATAGEKQPDQAVNLACYNKQPGKTSTALQ